MTKFTPNYGGPKYQLQQRQKILGKICTFLGEKSLAAIAQTNRETAQITQAEADQRIKNQYDIIDNVLNQLERPLGETRIHRLYLFKKKNFGLNDIENRDFSWVQVRSVLLPESANVIKDFLTLQQGNKTPLAKWLTGYFKLPERLKNNFINFDFASITLDLVFPIHQAPHVSEFARGLKQSWQESYNYVQKAKQGDFIPSDADNSYLDREERFDILSRLGRPPRHCFPIYFVSVGEGKNEKLVYIGITGNIKDENSHRFKGHAVAFKLLDPKYDGLKKRIYLGYITLDPLHKTYGELCLEWLDTPMHGYELLDSIESQLIFSFQPELNIKKKANFCAKYPFQNIAFFSSIKENNFLKGHLVHYSPTQVSVEVPTELKLQAPQLSLSAKK